MANISDYDTVIADTDEFRMLISSTIRDLCHAYLALLDRNDVQACVITLLAARLTLCEAQDEPSPRLQPKPTGIGNESLHMTLGHLIRTAEELFRQFEELDTSGGPDDIANWLTTRGKQIIKGLTYLIGDLLSEHNLYHVVQKLSRAC